MQYEELTKKIIGCAFDVYNEMGYGFLESVYEKCMLIELRKKGLSARAQQPVTVYYHNDNVGEFKCDIIVDNKIIIELKSVRQIIKDHKVQLVNYLTATHKDVGLLVNFGEKKVDIKRKVRKLSDIM